MTQAYQKETDYLRELLELVDRRLASAWMETTQSLEQQEEALRQELHRERQMERRCRATVDAGGAAPLSYLFHIFGLSAFERHCVYLSLATELDVGYEQRYAELQTDRCRLPSLALCLRTYPVFPEERAGLVAHWRTRRDWLSFFFSSGHAGIELQSDLSAGLKLQQRIPDFLLDCTSEDSLLAGWTELFLPEAEALPPLVIRGELLERMVRCVNPAKPEEKLLFYLQGGQGAGRRTLARHFCLGEGRPLLVADLAALLRHPQGWEAALLALCRETAIRGAALALNEFSLLLAGEETVPVREEESVVERAKQREGGQAHIRSILTQVARLCERAFLLSDVPWPPEQPCVPWRKTELQLDIPDTAQRILLWKHFFGESESINLDAVAIKFSLQPAQVAAAVEESLCQSRYGEKPLTEDSLHLACRAQLSHNLGKKAVRVNAAYTWEDLVLPPSQKRQMQNACAQVEYRHKVYDQWGFGKKIAYGRGLSMLFTGPPGTGKTMAAQVIANRLHLELYKVEVSGVMSKYIGETEKQLGAVFDEVKKSQSILFFDEADALFGKRSETKDAHDRYANVQTSYLLQKMEEYDGIVILTSNFSQNFDEAFKRRIKFIIDFPLPDKEQREQIWRSVLPADLPRQEDIDFDFLARSFELSGSSIKNIAVSAAFLAAAEEQTMGMKQLLLATQTEQHKTGKTMGRGEFGEYYHQIAAYQY